MNAIPVDVIKRPAFASFLPAVLTGEAICEAGAGFGCKFNVHSEVPSLYGQFRRALAKTGSGCWRSIQFNGGPLNNQELSAGLIVIDNTKEKWC